MTREENDKSTITGYATYSDMTRNVVAGNHLVDTIYNGPNSLSYPFSHNNNMSNIIAHKATANISGSKVLHVAEELDAHSDGRRWMDIMVGQARDMLTEPKPTKLDGNFSTVTANHFSWNIFATANAMEMIHPDPANTLKTVQTDLI